MEEIAEGQVVKSVPIEELPKQNNADMNPLGYTTSELLENQQWLRELQQRNPHTPDFIHRMCIDYFRLKGEDAIKQEMREEDNK